MEREEALAVLASRGWLAETPAGFRDQVLAGARLRRVQGGTTITLGGEEADDFVGLAQGTIAVTSILGRAGTPVTHLVHAVSWLGYGSLLLDRPRVVTAEARGEVWIAVIPKARLLPLLDEAPHGWRPFMRLLAEYGDTSAMIAADLLIPSSEGRLAATILRFAGQRRAGPAPAAVSRLPVTQAELAEAANLSRNAAGRILRRMAAAGLVALDYRGLEVRDADGLRKLAERDRA